MYFCQAFLGIARPARRFLPLRHPRNKRALRKTPGAALSTCVMNATITARFRDRANWHIELFGRFVCAVVGMSQDFVSVVDFAVVLLSDNELCEAVNERFNLAQFSNEESVPVPAGYGVHWCEVRFTGVYCVDGPIGGKSL